MRRATAPVQLAALLVAACSSVEAPRSASSSPPAPPGLPKPPVAEKIPYTVESPNGSRIDSYYWLRDDTRTKPEVLAYLRAENDYFAAQAARFADLTGKLAGEMLARENRDESTVPHRFKDYLYSTRYEAGKEYPIRVRSPLAGGAEQLLVDGNVEAGGHSYYSLNGTKVSPRQDLLAFTEDTAGRYQNSLRVREIATGRELPGRLSGIRPGVAWAADNRTIFYVENDPVTLLSKRVKRHVLGTDPALDPVIYEEADAAFYLTVSSSADEKFILLALESTESSEVLVLPADRTDAPLQRLAPREDGVLYYADHAGGRWVVRTDWQAPDFRLMTVADAEIGDRGRWREVVPSEPATFIDDFVAFRDYLVIARRRNGLLRLEYAPWSNLSQWAAVPSDEPASTQSFNANPDRDSTRLRFGETSLTQPASIFELDLASGTRKLLKRYEVPGYTAADYATERLWASARDGARVPVTIVYRKGLLRDGSAPLYQYGYGAYGATLDPEFDSSVVSLLDRGFVYALAHIRGGQELGRAWYDGGRLFHKKNSFTDFVDVTDFLVREKYVAPGKLFASGLSAGGLLMGAVANLAGEKYRAIAAHVPYVDAVTTMLDETIPLVTNEFDEWGNPKRKADYDYILSYSPYDNVAAKPYPAMLVTTGLHDSQVQYYEPAKWVARLRATKTDSNPLLFKINMEAGHGGKSGRLESLREVAEEYAFFLHQLGVND